MTHDVVTVSPQAPSAASAASAGSGGTGAAPPMVLLLIAGLAGDARAAAQAPASQPAKTGAPTSVEVRRDSDGAWFWKPAALREPLVTDRPDFTESSEAVPRGHAQLEGGYTFTLDRERKARRRDHTAPELLLRAGLADDFELRVGWEGYTWSSELFEAATRRGRRTLREDASQGASDVTVGFKHRFCEQLGPRPSLGLIGQLSAPSGSAGVSSGDVDPEAVVLWAYDLDERFGLAGNVRLGVPQEDGERFFQTAASISLSAAITSRLGGYVEYFGFYPAAEGSDAAHSMDGGLTYLVTDNFQLDLRAGFGLNEEADDFFAGVGFAFRW